MDSKTTKTVTITIEEYQVLLKNQKAKSACHAIPEYKLLDKRILDESRTLFKTEYSTILVKNAFFSTGQSSVNNGLSYPQIRKHILNEVFLRTGKCKPVDYTASDVMVMEEVWEHVKSRLVLKGQDE